MTQQGDEQLALLAGPKARKSRARVREPAAVAPVARVVVDIPLAHLDRPFDYLVPAHLDDAVVAGCRVRVRLAGRLVDAFVLERVAETEHDGALAYVERVLSSEPVLTEEIATLARAVADRQAGTMADVLRLAIPPRHAAAERQPDRTPRDPVIRPDAGLWERYSTGPAFLDAVARSDGPRAVWAALPGPTWPTEIATAVQMTLAAGRGAIVVVPDRRDADSVDRALTAALGGAEHHVVLHADIGPAERYRRFLAVSRGSVRAVVGTRPAVFAPVADLGLIVVWDDGDDSLAEPRAPYCHARDVAVLRSHLTGAGLLVCGLTRTAEGHALVSSGWAKSVAASRATVRQQAPVVEPTGDDAELARDPAARSARLPSLAWRRARDALEAGAPVLVQVPRRGYVPALACTRCRTRATCPHCSGPLSLSSGHAIAVCRWCGRPAGGWRCTECGGSHLRASSVGAARTAEELGRAFPGASVRTSGGDTVLARVPAKPLVIVATPGAEPVADGGYGAVLLLDSWALLARADLRASEETLRRWFAAAALARPGSAGGRVVVVADRGVPAVQALVRWDPVWAAERELADRVALGFPPAVRLADLTGAAADVTEFLGSLELPTSAETLGPVPIAELERMVIRVPREDGPALAAALKSGLGGRSARHDGGPVRVRLDPVDII
ncbi:MAG: hypothetical protein QOG53_933 [Frankiales bacterium]|nr:hypothetical protein [Frankiales bacterium]